ncbi:MAG: hypothetical protein J7M38_15285, partial [Armatimonadetes bacterium]|nr:hypothetical protein [Armatimonadota bacterium]
MMRAIVLMVFAMLSCVGWSADVRPTPDEFVIPKLAVTIDADLGEWDLANNGYEVNPEKTGEGLPSVALINDPGNPYHGAADQSAIVALAWDDDYLYFCGDVTDDDLRGIRPDTPHNVGPPGWKCDSVMLQIHSFRKPLRTNSPYTDSPNLNARYEVKPGGRGRLIDDPKNRLLDTADAYWKLTEHSLLATRETERGYIVEAAVPWADLGVVPQAGDVLRACFLLGDIDTGEKLNQLGWN